MHRFVCVCSFHDPLDGVKFVFDLQKALLKLEWPPELLEHPQAAPVTTSSSDGDILIFAGLRLRSVLHTGWPSKIEVCCTTLTWTFTCAIECLKLCIPEASYAAWMLLL